MELLISGISLLALFQLSGMLQGWIEWWLMRLGQESAGFARFVYVYTQAATLSLAFTFLVHLVLRARWVALVGVSAVCSQGVAWDRLRCGPLQQRTIRERLGDLAAITRRPDIWATQAFAVGVGISGLIVLIAALMLVLYLLAVALSLSSNGAIDVHRAMTVMVGVSVLPLVVALAVDRWRGAALSPDSRWARLIARTYAVYDALGLTRASNPLVTLPSIQAGERRATVLSSLAIFTFCLVATLTVPDGSRAMLGYWGLLPESARGSEREVHGEHYADARLQTVSTSRAPYIQAPVIEGPYLMLVIPYDPIRHPPVLRQHCGPAPEPSALLDCAARWHDVQVDGHPVSVPFEFHTDTRTQVRGFSAMIDVRALSPGRHELVLRRPPTPGRSRPEQGFDRIPFWR